MAAFTIYAHGIARKRAYIFGPKRYADPGDLISGSELLETLSGKGKFPLSGMGSGARKEASHLASIVIISQLKDELFWYGQKRGRLMVGYSKAGVWGGVWRQPSYRNEVFLFRDTNSESATEEFFELLQSMGLNKWGYLRGFLDVLSGYDIHCESYSIKPGAVSLLMQISED